MAVSSSQVLRKSHTQRPISTENTPDIHSAKEYDDLMFTCGSESNGIENMYYHLFKDYPNNHIEPKEKFESDAEKYFDFEVKASEVGFMKPNPKIFEYALKLTKCKPSEMLHIGDSYDKDIIGAKSVNMNYIWLRHDSKIEKDIKTENIVDNFSQIPESIKKLG